MGAAGIYAARAEVAVAYLSGALTLNEETQHAQVDANTKAITDKIAAVTTSLSTTITDARRTIEHKIDSASASIASEVADATAPAAAVDKVTAPVADKGTPKGK